MLDVSDLIMLNIEQPGVFREIKGLLFNFRSVKQLPAHLENLLRGEESEEPPLDLVLHNIL